MNKINRAINNKIKKKRSQKWRFCNPALIRPLSKNYCVGKGKNITIIYDEVHTMKREVSKDGKTNNS